MKIQGISDFFMHECGDFAWDDILLDDDRIVPHHGPKRLNDHSTLGENNKRCCRELASNSNITGGSATINVDHGKENSEISPLSKTWNTMLEKDLDLWSLKLNDPLPSVSDNEVTNGTSRLACDSTIPLPRGMKSNDRYLNSGELVEHSIAILNNKATLVEDSPFNFPTSDGHHTGNDIFENAETKNSNDILYYYGWSETEDFDGIDRLFRSDSTLGLGVCIEDELSWISPADDIGASGDALKSDAKFLCRDPSEEKTISLNHDFSNGNSPNYFAMTNAPISYKDCSRTSEKSDYFRSSFTGPDIKYSKDGFITQDQGIGFNSNILPRISNNSHFKSGNAAVISEQQKKIKLQSLSEGKSKVHCLENGSLAQISNPQNEVTDTHSGLTSDEVLASVQMQQQHDTPTSNSDSCLEDPISNIHLKESHLSDPSQVNLDQFNSETSDLAPIPPNLSQLQHMDDFSSFPFKETALRGSGQIEKLKSFHGNHDGMQNGGLMIQASISDSSLERKYENYDPQVASSANGAEMGSSNMQECLTVVPYLDDISLEAASFRQLQRVSKQLDLRTNICIRDSLYRLALSAELRHHNQNINNGFGDERDAIGRASGTEGTKRCAGFMDMETNTNPIDRSVAHLLFHRPIQHSCQ